jgi:hypothetical protein
MMLVRCQLMTLCWRVDVLKMLMLNCGKGGKKRR